MSACVGDFIEGILRVLADENCPEALLKLSGEESTPRTGIFSAIPCDYVIDFTFLPVESHLISSMMPYE